MRVQSSSISCSFPTWQRCRIELFVFSVRTGVALSAPQTEDFEAADDYGEEDTIPDEDVSSSKMPNFTSVPQHFRVRMGDSVRLPCEVDDLGDYTLLWKREEGDILTAGTILISKDNRISHEGNSLVIRGINLSDQGAYFCQIPSTQDQRELRHYIDILGKSRDP
jgi:hypothetical protein